jgi:deoxyribodipyrimidine photo-lyase
VKPTAASGGSKTATELLRRFLEKKLPLYSELRNHPAEEVTSGLSPYLHFGHMSTHQIFVDLMKQEDWSPDKLSAEATGKRRGWWNTSPAAESFLDELITWRELGYNMASKRPDYENYNSLPDWANRTLSEHSDDPRPNVYTLEQFEQAQTHDPLWNAAQRELLSQGRIHNYLRMLWGKKILEWSRSPQDALEIMVELNNKYALDGSDPNSYSGIFWVLGRYDRPWGPERPIFGKVRYMSSENTARKFDVKPYLKKYGHL